MLDLSPFQPGPAVVQLNKLRPEGEMIPDHNDGSKSGGATRARMAGSGNAGVIAADVDE
jgi:hypothetical protein